MWHNYLFLDILLLQFNISSFNLARYLFVESFVSILKVLINHFAATPNGISSQNLKYFNLIHQANEFYISISEQIWNSDCESERNKRPSDSRDGLLN
jgi:hypothetical protein